MNPETQMLVEWARHSFAFLETGPDWQALVAEKLFESSFIGWEGGDPARIYEGGR
ncbi:MAG: hypothetical protein Q8Q06_00395 [bacterium]|nr:hypothetical protein [bacterium]